MIHNRFFSPFVIKKNKIKSNKEKDIDKLKREVIVITNEFMQETNTHCLSTKVENIKRVHATDIMYLKPWPI